MAKKTIQWSEKDRFVLTLSLLIGISSGLLSATLVSSVYEMRYNPNQTNLYIYLINWVVIGVIFIFL